MNVEGLRYKTPVYGFGVASRELEVIYIPSEKLEIDSHGNAKKTETPSLTSTVSSATIRFSVSKKELERITKEEEQAKLKVTLPSALVEKINAKALEISQIEEKERTVPSTVSILVHEILNKKNRKGEFVEATEYQREDKCSGKNYKCLYISSLNLHISELDGRAIKTNSDIDYKGIPVNISRDIAEKINTLVEENQLLSNRIETLKKEVKALVKPLFQSAL